MIIFPDKQFMQFRNIKDFTYNRSHVQNSERQQLKPQHIQTIYPQQVQQIRTLHQGQPEPIRSSQNKGFGTASMEQLNQDLNRLKSQLQRLSQEQDLSRTNSSRQELYEGKARARSNLSADNSMSRGREPAQNNFRSPFETSNVRFISSVPQYNHFNPNKSSQTIKVVPIVNPNKKQRERQIIIPIEQSPSKEGNQITNMIQNKQLMAKNQAQLQRVLKQSKQLKEELQSAKFEIKQLNVRSQDQKEKSKADLLILENSLNNKIQKQRIQYQAIIKKLQQEINRNRKESQAIQSPSFDQALKLHLQKQEQMTRILEERTEEVGFLKQQVEQQAREIQRLRVDLDLKQIKIGVQLRAKIQKLQIQIKQITNELQTTQKNLEAVQQRYQAAVRQIQQKDEFILKHFVGRVSDKEHQNLQQLLQQYKTALAKQKSLYCILASKQRQEQQ